MKDRVALRSESINRDSDYYWVTVTIWVVSVIEDAEQQVGNPLIALQRDS